METRRTAVAFPPGDIIREELDARGWSLARLAEASGLSRPVVRGIVAGKLAATPEAAERLGAALGTGATLWINMEYRYRQRGESAPRSG